ncbi:hypothetical protein KKA15_03120 [Patescibacteria group bacterium]|nr:hypothetical protein [Patescibacteria group bacterium]
MNFTQLTSSINKKEWKFVFAIIILTIIVTTLPYVYGWLKAPEGKVSTGFHLLMSTDQPVYYSYISQASEGNLLFTNLFSSETHDHDILNIIWLFPGTISRLFNISPQASFQISRICFIPILLIISYLLISYFFDDKRLRKLSLIFFTFASGWGFYYMLFFIDKLANILVDGKYIWPADLWIIESFVFLMTYYSPHHIAAIALILLIFLLMFLCLENNKRSYAIIAGILALLLFSFHPFHIFSLFPIIFVIFTFQSIKEKRIVWKKYFNYIIFVAISSPIIIYYNWFVNINLNGQIKYLQNTCPTSTPFLLLIGYGFLLLLPIIGSIYLLYSKKLKDNKLSLLVIWLYAQLIIIYLPFVFQRRMVQGMTFPMSLLTVYLLVLVYTSIKNKYRWLNNPVFIIFVLIIMFFSTPLVHIATDIMLFNRGDDIYYIDNSELKVFQWLKTNTKDDEIIFSGKTSGNLIPGFSTRRVYNGHTVETINSYIKENEANWFYSKNRDDVLEKDFLNLRNIDYVYYSFREKRLGDYNPVSKKYLFEIYSNDDYFVYQVL